MRHEYRLMPVGKNWPNEYYIQRRTVGFMWRTIWSTFDWWDNGYLRYSYDHYNKEDGLSAIRRIQLREETLEELYREEEKYKKKGIIYP